MKHEGGQNFLCRKRTLQYIRVTPRPCRWGNGLKQPGHFSGVVAMQLLARAAKVGVPLRKLNGAVLASLDFHRLAIIADAVRRVGPAGSRARLLREEGYRKFHQPWPWWPTVAHQKAKCKNPTVVILVAIHTGYS